MIKKLPLHSAQAKLCVCVSFDRIERYDRYLTNSEARELHDALMGTVYGLPKIGSFEP